jgi:hypothetical protein
MRGYYIYIALIILVVCLLILNIRIQGFTSELKTVVLLGDSILKNNNYVPADKSVESLLQVQIQSTGNTMHFLAKDDSHISDIEKQTTNMPNGAYIFLSVGGNDILSYIRMNSINSQQITSLFNKYRDLVNSILQKYTPKRIYMLNIYFPTDMSLQPFYKYISQWNKLLENFSKSNSLFEIIYINNACKDSSDFVDLIEPSSICSKKITDIIFGLI